MKKSIVNEPLDSITRVRIPAALKQSLVKISAEEHTSTSEILRNCIYKSLLDTPPSPPHEVYQHKIQQIVMINQIHNAIMANPDIPKKYKTILTKEFENYV